ncbi:MAG: hypothetical protein V4543_06590 [Bacteroidota bacterium]
MTSLQFIGKLRAAALAAGIARFSFAQEPGNGFGGNLPLPAAWADTDKLSVSQAYNYCAFRQVLIIASAQKGDEGLAEAEALFSRIMAQLSADPDLIPAPIIKSSPLPAFSSGNLSAFSFVLECFAPV